MLKNQKVYIWLEGAIIASFSMGLSFIPVEIPSTGIDLSLGMVPLIIFSYRRGLLAGMTTGFVWGLLNIVLGTAMKNFITVPQIIFEYPFAFMFGGMGGIFSKNIKQNLIEKKERTAIFFAIFGVFLAVFSRWFWHFWAGVFVWGVYAPDGMNPYIYSAIINGTSAVINSMFCCVSILLLLRKFPFLILQGK